MASPRERLGGGHNVPQRRLGLVDALSRIVIGAPTARSRVASSAGWLRRRQ